MAKNTKKQVIAKKKMPPKVVNPLMTNNQFVSMKSMVQNEMMTLHRELLNRLMNTQTDIDNACGYPVDLNISDYRTMYDRMGLAKRAVQIWPDECWQSLPEISENEKEEETLFEKAWKELEKRLSLFAYLHRIDILSGIGSYGIMLLGLGDGKALHYAAKRRGRKEKKDLLFLRTFDESVLNIDATERTVTNPRFGMPTMYSINYMEGGTSGVAKRTKVHWTRVLHVADNRECSEVLGVSRLKTIYNNLYDAKKVSGGSGEMFWKGGFPGYAFELTPEAAQMGAVIDAESIKEQMLSWSRGLQRWLAVTGVTTKSISPQVADPTGHLDVHLKLIAVSLGVPYRVLLGSEEAKLASVQDKRTWNSRVAQRRQNYLTPKLVRPFIDQLIELGVLPEPKEYFVVWPDLNVATEDDKAKVASYRTEAFSKYVQGNVDALIPPRQYFTQVHKFSDEVVEMILKEQKKYESVLNPEEPPAEPNSDNEE
jgi:hypothetical protein